MSTTGKGVLGFKGEKGDSAYQVAVKNGFVGTEKDWLATLGTTNYVGETKATFVGSKGQKEFGLPTGYTSESVVEVYIEGERLNSNEYTINSTNRILTLTNAISVDGTTVEIVLLTMASHELPIVETINSSSTNETTPGTKAVYDLVQDTQIMFINIANTKMNNSDVVDITGSAQSIAANETKIVDINYPSGFNKSNTHVVSKMTSNNNVYYESIDLTPTTNGFPIIKMIALLDSNIRVWITNTNSSEAKIGYYKITLLKK